MKTNTCPRGKKKLDCITSLDIQYLKTKKSKKKSTFVISKMISLQIERNPNPVMNLRVIGKIYLHDPRFDDIETRSNILYIAWRSKQTSGQTNRMTYFPRFAFKVIFFAY